MTDDKIEKVYCFGIISGDGYNMLIDLASDTAETCIPSICTKDLDVAIKVAKHEIMKGNPVALSEYTVRIHWKGVEILAVEDLLDTHKNIDKLGILKHRQHVRSSNFTN